MRTRRTDVEDTGPHYGTDGARHDPSEYESSLEDLGVASFAELQAIFSRPSFLQAHRRERTRVSGSPLILSNDEVSLNDLERADAKARRHRVARRDRHRPQARELQAARLAVQSAALLGRALPDRVRCRGATTTRSREDKLPVALPALEDYKPAESEDPQPLLGQGDGLDAHDRGRGGRRWARPGLRRSAREANTMPGWAGSCWYHISYLRPEERPRRDDRGTRPMATGWARAAWTCTSAAPSTRCCTCSTRASGT